MLRGLKIVFVSLLLLTSAACQVWTPFPPTPTVTPVRPTATFVLRSPTPPPTTTPAPPTSRPPTGAPSPGATPSTATPVAPTRTPPTSSGGTGGSSTQTLTAPEGTVAGGQSAGDPKAPELGNTGYDVDLYTLRLKLDVPGKRLAGHVQMDAISSLDRLGQISLDFVDGYTVSAVTVDGATTPFLYRNDKLIVNLPRAFNKGQKFSLRIDYHGAVRPIRSRYATFAELGLQIRDDGTAFAISEPDGSRAWFPCNDHPLDKARFRFEITVQAPLVVASNGVLRETRSTPDGTLYVWDMAQPMAPYLATLMVAPYERIEDRSPNGVPLRHYVYKDRRADQEALFRNVGVAVDWFSERLGRYPFDEFGFTVVGLRGASLETQSNVLLSEQMLSEGVLVHELAHMWFGNIVSISSWADIWRNEGFATYFTTLWERRNDPPEALARSMNEVETNLLQKQSGYALGNPPPGQLFAQDSYLKGAWLAHMLHRQVGDENFFKGLRLYFERYRDRAASRAEFEAVFSEVSGQDLTAFFARWLDTAPVPELNVTWTAQRFNGAYALDVQVCQTHALAYPGELEVEASNGTARQTVKISLSAGGRARAILPYQPTSITTDPNERLLAKEAVQQVQRLTACP